MACGRWEGFSVGPAVGAVLVRKDGGGGQSIPKERRVDSRGVAKVFALDPGVTAWTFHQDGEPFRKGIEAGENWADWSQCAWGAGSEDRAWRHVGGVTI